MNALPVGIAKRLVAAEGYLELGLPHRALSELDGLEAAGVLEAPLLFLRGTAYKHQSRFDEAIELLRKAAAAIPAPFNKAAWLSVCECYRSRGDAVTAELVESLINTTQPNGTLVVNVFLQHPQATSDRGPGPLPTTDDDASEDDAT